MRDERKAVLKQGLHSVQWYPLHLRWHLACLTHNSSDQQMDLMNVHGSSGMFDLILFHQGKSVDWKKNKAIFLEQHTSFTVFNLCCWVSEWLARWLPLHFKKWELSSSDLIHRHSGFCKYFLAGELQASLAKSFRVLYYFWIEQNSQHEVVRVCLLCLHINQCSDSEQTSLYLKSTTAHTTSLF